jgi:hypothetical protein
MNGIASARDALLARLWALARVFSVAGSLLVACGPEGSNPKPGVDPRVAKEPVANLASFVPPPNFPLGVSDLAALSWRERSGTEAFRRARAAERRSDWSGMVGDCQTARTGDPSHLEASWLLAAGLVRLGRFPDATAPLLRAIAGDPGKWWLPALQLPLFAPFWASGSGDGLRQWMVSAEPRLQATLTGAVIVVQKGRLVAFDRVGQRWFNLTRRMRVWGALIKRPLVAFIAAPRGARSSSGEAQLGIVDLRTGLIQEFALPAAHRFEVVAMSEHDDGREPAIVVRGDRGPWMSVGGEDLDDL